MSSKGSRHAKIAQATSTAVRVVRARSTRVEQRLEACEYCTSCINGGTGSVHQEHRPSLADLGCVSISLFNEHSTYHFTLIAERGELSRWRATFSTW